MNPSEEEIQKIKQRESSYKSMMAYRIWKRELGFCREGGCFNIARKYSNRCENHIKEDKNRMARKRKSASLKGKCTRCFVAPPEEGKKRCRKCINKHTEYKKKCKENRRK